jgi:hypothetical protein
VSTTVPASLDVLKKLAVRPLVPGEAVHRTGEVRKRSEVATPLEVCPVENGGKPHHLGRVLRAVSGDQAIHALDGILELGAVAVDAGHATRDQEPLTDELVAELALGAGRLVRARRADLAEGRRHLSPSPQLSLHMRSIAALAERTRSLLIMSAAL